MSFIIIYFGFCQIIVDLDAKIFCWQLKFYRNKTNALNFLRYCIHGTHLLYHSQIQQKLYEKTNGPHNQAKNFERFNHSNGSEIDFFFFC